MSARSFSSLANRTLRSQVLPVPLSVASWPSFFPPCGARSVTSVTDAGFWKGLVPRSLRDQRWSWKFWDRRSATSTTAKEWNPATFFIVGFIVLGSVEIHLVTIRNQFASYMRRSEVQMQRLREVLGRLQRGEEFDVEKALGKGDPDSEEDWEKLLKEIVKQPTNPPPQPKKRAEPAKQLEADSSTTFANTSAKTVTSSTNQPKGLDSFY